ncbi:MAG: hypothetical protein ABJB74_00185 [Gemmatimonas sp.]
MNANIRARVFGALLLAAVFVAGAMSGVAYTRVKRPGVSVNVRMVTTRELPRELRDLGLTAPQEDSLRVILRTGEQRTIRVLNDFEPQLRQAMDSMDTAIHAALTPEQRVKFDAARARRPKEEVERLIDTVRK